MSTSGGPYLSIAAAFIIGTGTFSAPAAGLGFLFLAVVAFVSLAALRLLLEGFLAGFLDALFGFLEAFLGAFFFFVTIPICSQFVRRA